MYGTERRRRRGVYGARAGEEEIREGCGRDRKKRGNTRRERHRGEEVEGSENAAENEGKEERK